MELFTKLKQQLYQINLKQTVQINRQTSNNNINITWFSKQESQKQNHQLQQMHQISLQQLSNNIKKHVNDWTSSDISQWLSLNQIQVNTHKLFADNLNGVKITKMSPNDWMDYGTSRYIARQIVQWLEQQVEEFNGIVSAKFLSQPIKQQQIKQRLSGQVQPLSQNNQPDNSQQFSKWHRFYDHNIIKNEKKQILELPKFQRKIRSYEHLKQEQEQIFKKDIEQIKFQKCQSLCQNGQNPKPSREGSIKNEGSISSQQKGIQVPLGVLKESQNFIQKQSNDQKSQGVISQQEPEQLAQNPKNMEEVRINSDVTERRQKKKKKKQKNKNQNISSNQNLDLNVKEQGQKEKQMIQNESIFVSKWVKKKKQDTKTLNQRLKKNKDSRDPKIYNYINLENNIDKTDKNSQKSAEIKGISKRVFSAQQFCPAKMVSPNQRADYKIPVRQNPITPYSSKVDHIPTPSIGLQNPMVKFATSQFILCTPEVQDKKSFFFQKKLKIKNEKTQYIVSGNTKIGRLKSNQIVLSDQSVSRQHAEIIPFVDMAGKTRFLLKDVGSKFGTFVQCRTIQENIQGKSFLIGDAQIQIVSAQPSRPITPLNPPLNRRLKFDLKVRIDRQKDIFIQNRSIITIGKRMGNDIKIQSNCCGAKIWYQKQKKVCLEALEGSLYQKLIQHEPWDIQANTNLNGQVQVVFGWLKVGLSILELCFVCEAKRKDCQCRNQEGEQKNNGKN